MNNKFFYTSLELSKALAEAGCDLESNVYWYDIDGKEILMRIRDFIQYDYKHYRFIICPAYHLLEDICVRYAKDFWGEYRDIETGEYEYERASENILYLLQQNQKQQAEDYIRQHSIIFRKRHDQ